MSSEHKNLKRLTFAAGIIASAALVNDFNNFKPVSDESLKVVVIMVAEQESPGGAIVYSSENVYSISGSVEITPQAINETAILSGAPKNIEEIDNQTNKSQSNSDTRLPDGNIHEAVIPEEIKLQNKKEQRV